MDYTVIRETNLEQLIKQVQEHIAGGWVPLGGVSASLAMGATLFCQAMTKP
jgi:hypothetical protein